MSVRKKVIVFNALGLRRRVDRMFVYASSQRDFAVRRLRMRPEQVQLTSFMVDTEFFAMERVTPAPRRMICAAGLEFRDYETLVDAVRGLDVDVVIAAASPWSKRSSAVGDALPANVTVCKLTLFDLRQLYADARFVVVPLLDTEFQAGVTTILEAMAMSKAVVCTKTPGQTDVIVEGVTGLYVSPADVTGLRRAISALLDDPDQASRLGVAGRGWVVANADVSVYADRLAEAVLSQP